jgi:ABC-type polysaccharide/polyol phosphate transport system ATPase subunit
MARPAVALEDVWLKFNLRLYRKRLTLRGAAVRGLYSLVRPRRRRNGDDFWALQGVTLGVPEGEVLGVVGPNGAGKSTLLRVIAGIYAPDRGRVEARGTIATLLSFGAGFDLRRPGRENIHKNATLLGLSREQIDERMAAIVDMSGLGEFIDAPVMTYSSGMRARLGFSIAVHVDPDILLIDEVVGAGDERFRQRVGSIFDQLSGRRKTIVFVTHSQQQLQQYCTHAVWMEEGRVQMHGTVEEVGAAYLASSKGGS